MDEYPDQDEFYDLEHEDEYEIERELEAAASNTPKSHFNGISQSQKKINETQKQNSTQQATLKHSFENEMLNIGSQALSGKCNGTSQLQLSENTRKRSIDLISYNDLLKGSQNVDQIDFELDKSPEKKKPCWNRPKELIELILERRKNHYDSNDIKSKFENVAPSKNLKNSISRRVPMCNFVAVTRSEDSERFYIKVSEKKYDSKQYQLTSGSLIKSFNKLKDEAEEILMKKMEKASQLPVEPLNSENVDSQLWVDKYRPQRYIELLSDENVNRSLLYWLKLWDKIVFAKEVTVKPNKKKNEVPKFKNKFKQKENVPDHDSKGFPTQRIALLAGPPGLGKTTLAHIAAKHAGYNIVELNASDDRGPEAFREALLASTQMKSFIDKDKRPNCLVLDEIDGAPGTSIDLLLKFIHGKLAPKGRAAKTMKENDGCRRPIICICNDLYTPSLRPLRSMALIVKVPEISPSNLAERLSNITRREGLQVDSRLLLQLAEKSSCDVRACLGILQYTGGGADMLQNLALGLKDTRKGLFDSWKELLHISVGRRGNLTNTNRILKVIQIVNQGEPERLMQGIFHNYPEICKDKIISVSEALNWFEFYDQVNTLVMERQSWVLMPYATSAFVSWHLYLANTQLPKISYPTSVFEVNQKLERNKAILTTTKKTSKIDISTLVTDVLPFLPDVLSPRLRAVNIQLYSPKEKEELDKLVNVMLDFGLSLVQERKPEGGYEYLLDPNVWDIGTFPNCKIRKPLTYAVKQIVIQELESARLQRAAMYNANGAATNDDNKSKKTNNKPTLAGPSRKIVDEPEPSSSQSFSKFDESVPNHLRQLTPKELEPTKEKKSRNFFHAFQTLGQEKLKAKLAQEKELGIVDAKIAEKEERRKDTKRQKDLLKSSVWFQYKEGYTNAVRRTILMKDLLKDLKDVP